ncbi:MAG: pyridoxamine 5'-phosphate oxidase family protein [Oscillospiraceae bacterium]|nr:pyridoxamine 5'-phosphate oxidase family protein [Oscillospiraceae bacterium]
MRREGVLRRSGSNNSDPCCDLAVWSILAEELDAPSAPAFRPLARSRQELSKEESIAVLHREKRGVLSVLGDEGYPYGLPIDHWYDPVSGRLYFHSGPTGHKIDAIRRDDRASYCVIERAELSDDGWSFFFNSVVVFGRIEIVKDHDRALEISRQISYRFTEDREQIEREVSKSGARVLCFALIPEHISGKRVHEK